MNDLAGGKQLAAIAKKVPIFNKREEIFLTLSEHQVPMVRAAWFLKMTASYNSAMSEAKTKKRQMPDPSQEWTISLQRCCKDIFIRLTEWYNGGSGAALTTSINAAVPPTPGAHPGGGPNLGPGHPPNMHQNNPTAPNNPSMNPMASSQNSATMNGNLSNIPGQNPSQQSTPSPSASTADDGSGILKQWEYCTELAKFLYEVSVSKKKPLILNPVHEQVVLNVEFSHCRRAFWIVTNGCFGLLTCATKPSLLTTMHGSHSSPCFCLTFQTLLNPNSCLDEYQLRLRRN